MNCENVNVEKKLGIISLFNMKNVNYGNRLQAYALNHYIRNHYKWCEVETLYFNIYDKILKTKQPNPLLIISNKVKRLVLRFAGLYRLSPEVHSRLVYCNEFSINNIELCSNALSWEELLKSDYDAFIVGSDIVWGQMQYGIGRIKFLDFQNKRSFVKLSYGASFGRDWIPEENIIDIKRCLNDFSLISVREASSINLLESIGVKNAKHVLDPTLLLLAEEWEKIERKPEYVPENYIFVYLLGRKVEERQFVSEFARIKDLPIVTVPYASGETNKVDSMFGNVQVLDCAPEEWIWLIHHAEYVVTDSFHGTVFSTIFKRKFLVLTRRYEENINNRMMDYLRMIGQEDKLLETTNLKMADNSVWKYGEIDSLLEQKRADSILYLDKAMTIIQKA